jgi:hypothetical protein
MHEPAGTAGGLFAVCGNPHLFSMVSAAHQTPDAQSASGFVASTPPASIKAVCDVLAACEADPTRSAWAAVDTFLGEESISASLAQPAGPGAEYSIAGEHLMALKRTRRAVESVAPSIPIGTNNILANDSEFERGTRSTIG